MWTPWNQDIWFLLPIKIFHELKSASTKNLIVAGEDDVYMILLRPILFQFRWHVWWRRRSFFSAGRLRAVSRGLPPCPSHPLCLFQVHHRRKGGHSGKHTDRHKVPLVDSQERTSWKYRYTGFITTMLIVLLSCKCVGVDYLDRVMARIAYNCPSYIPKCSYIHPMYAESYG